MANVAVVVGPEFEDSELEQPCNALREAGHHVTIVGQEAHETLTGKRGNVEVEVDVAAADARAEMFDALLIPGGHSPDNLRIDEDVVGFVKTFVRAGKPIAAVCHGPQLLIEADGVDGRTMTSWPSVRKDLVNAGARWIDEEVVVDGHLVTSRKPDDLPAFSRALLRQLDQQQTAAAS